MKRILVFLVSMMVLFSSMSSFALPATSSNVGKTTIVTGEITKVNPGVPYNKLMLALKTSTQSYILTGMTAKLNLYVGYTAKITGNIYKGPQGILMLNVKSYKIISKSIPTPTKAPIEIIRSTELPKPTATSTPTPSKITNNMTMYGYLYNLNSDMKKFYLQSDKGVYELIGNTEGMEKVVGNKVEVTGNYVYTLVATEYPLFSIVSYKVIAVPSATPVVKEISIADNGGYVYLENGQQLMLTLESNPTTGYGWEYIEKVDGNVLKEISHKYIQNSASEGMVGVGGKDVWTYQSVSDGTAVINLGYLRSWESTPPAKTFIIKVVVGSSSTSTPTPTPTPTPTIESSKVHTIISTKIDHFGDASLALDVNDLSGITTVSWTEGTKSAFFNSKVTVLINGIKVIYQVELIETVESDRGSITGLFNITKDGTVIAKGVKGQVYGLETSIGYYFKFYSEDARILIAPIATERVDF